MKFNLHSIYQSAYSAFNSGKLNEAEELLWSLVNIAPAEFDATHLLGIVYSCQGKHDLAIDIYHRALKIKNDDPALLSNLGSSLNAIGRNDDAILVFNDAVSLNPNDSELQFNLANVLCDTGLIEEALIHYELSIKLNPNYYQAHNNYGKALYDLNLYARALEHFNHALFLNPNFLECLINKGALLVAMESYSEANFIFDTVISFRPNFAEAYFNKGVSLHKSKFYSEAAAQFDKAISLKPDYAEAYFNKGICLHKFNRHEEAISQFKKALSLKSDINWICGYLLHTQMTICDWSEFNNLLKYISIKTNSNEKVSTPFILLSITDDPLLQRKSSEIYTQSQSPPSSSLNHLFHFHKKQKVRLGYFSADFHNHATSFLTAELFELHNKDKFELYGFSFGPSKSDEMRKRLKHSFTQFLELGHMSNIQIAQISRDLNIDIAIDLKGFTQDSRCGIFSHRAAPLQINFLGYPGSTGADYFDYIVADKTLIPTPFQDFYSEKIIYLPNCYQPNDRKRTISERIFTRQELNLPDHSFVFCCFNNNYKILPSTFESWMRILKSVENSVLWLLEDNPYVVQNLRKEAENHFVDPRRLIFAQRTSHADHLSRHRQADLFLDTFPYGAHTTSSDALWAGLPVITLAGQSFASRVCASLLNNVGLSELITNTQAEYEHLAFRLATHESYLADIRARLKKNQLSSPLFDTPLFTRNLEDAYLKIYEMHLANQKPENIAIV